jgi:proton-dependent oligopeptide transporter, POT family
MDTSTVSDLQVDSAKDTSGIGGHPRGLTTLFFTEMWERFSYYGMRAILVLFMVAPPAEGGLGFSVAKATAIYGTYTGAVYLMSVPGGWVADNILGARLAVLIGGILIAFGHFSMAFPVEASFYGGLILIVLGTGLLKPNISTMVGGLYSQDDPRRDGGFSIFYMGINIGAMISPLVCGYLAQHPQFKSFLASMGFNPEASWHWGFAAAGVGMTLGLIQYLIGRQRLATVGQRPRERKAMESIGPDAAQHPAAQAETSSMVKVLKGASSLFLALAFILAAGTVVGLIMYFNGQPMGVDLSNAFFWVLLSFTFGLLATVAKYFQNALAAGERARAVAEAKRLSVIPILFFFSVLFWMAFEQAGSSLNLFAEELTRNSIFGFAFPSSWFQSVNSLFIIGLAPVFAWLWVRLGDRQPSSPTKFALGLIFAGLGFVVVAYASSLTGGDNKVGPMWLILVYLLHTIGELCLSPVGLSMVTKLAPAKLVGLMMGVWFLSISMGNYAAGWVAGSFEAEAQGALVKLFGTVAVVTIAAGVLLAVLAPFIRKLMGRVN